MSVAHAQSSEWFSLTEGALLSICPGNPGSEGSALPVILASDLGHTLPVCQTQF